jgi:hypothetical protein
MKRVVTLDRPNNNNVYLNGYEASPERKPLWKVVLLICCILGFYLTYTKN